MERPAQAFGIRLATRAFSLLVAAVNITPAHTATLFDGDWSVRISASRAACGDGTVLVMRIADGRIAADGVTAAGRVSAQGAIRVALSDGLRRASGTGRLSARTGSGIWQGPLCAGTWTAQRR